MRSVALLGHTVSVFSQVCLQFSSRVVRHGFDVKSCGLPGHERKRKRADALLSGQMMAAVDIIGQRFRAVETSILEEGGWGVARHLEPVTETRVSSVTPWSVSCDGGGGAPVPSGQAGPTTGPALETVDRASELKKESGRSQSACQL